MNNNELILLINRELDGDISAIEKAGLDDMIAHDSKARILHQQMHQAMDILETIPEVDPGTELRKKVINSIDFDRYKPQAAHQNSKKVEARWSARPMVKIAYAFGVGIFAGAILATSLLINLQEKFTVNTENLSGTIGTNQPMNLNVTETLPVHLPEVSGQLVLKHDGHLYGLELDLEGKEAFEIVFLNIQDRIDIQRFEPGKTRGIRFEYFQESAKIFTESGKLHSLIYFMKKNDSPEFIKLGIVSSDKILFTHSFSIRPEAN